MMGIIKAIGSLALIICMFAISCMIGIMPLMIGFWLWQALLGA